MAPNRSFFGDIDNEFRSILFINHNSDQTVYSRSILLECAKYFAQQGKKVLFISPQPFDAMPPSISDVTSQPDPYIYEQMRFVYIDEIGELSKFIPQYCKERQPPTIWIITQLDHYTKQSTEESFPARLVTSLINAVKVCILKTSIRGVLLAYHAIPKDHPSQIIRNYFTVVWDFIKNDNVFILKNNLAEENQPCEFLFAIKPDSATLDKIFKYEKTVS